jgi:hypothetical protein
MHSNNVQTYKQTHSRLYANGIGEHNGYIIANNKTTIKTTIYKMTTNIKNIIFGVTSSVPKEMVEYVHLSLSMSKIKQNEFTNPISLNRYLAESYLCHSVRT